jgi:hypothetical protein
MTTAAVTMSVLAVDFIRFLLADDEEYTLSASIFNAVTVPSDIRGHGTLHGTPRSSVAFAAGSRQGGDP